MEQCSMSAALALVCTGAAVVQSLRVSTLNDAMAAVAKYLILLVHNVAAASEMFDFDLFLIRNGFDESTSFCWGIRWWHRCHSEAGANARLVSVRGAHGGSD